MDRKKKEAMAVFRYGIIAPVLHAGGQGQADYFRKLAQKDLEVPFLGPKRYAASTFKSWLQNYRRRGFEGLLPRSRRDAGQSRVITAQLSELVAQILSEYPDLPVTHLRQRLIASGEITSRRISENTLRRHIAQARLRPPAPPPQGRKRFEKPQANDMWTLDFMHGPRVVLPARKRLGKTYLLAAIDDHSRFITAAHFFAAEDSSAVIAALKEAFARHGLPKILYCDNGPAFSSRYLTLACARLGLALVHSKPYDSPSRGKIERFFRRLRSSFLSQLPRHSLTQLEDLNARFQHWLDQSYHRTIHCGIGEPPLTRYMRSLASLQVRLPGPQELDRVFYHTLTRKVTKDALVSIAGKLWEVPAAYIGLKVQIRHPQGQPQELYLFENDRSVARLHPLDRTENASRHRPLRFALQKQEDPHD